jgi:hypothetical protein
MAVRVTIYDARSRDLRSQRHRLQERGAHHRRSVAGPTSPRWAVTLPIGQYGAMSERGAGVASGLRSYRGGMA